MPSNNASARTGILETTLGEAVHRYRVSSGMTLAVLTERSGVSGAMISKIERGKVSPSLSTLDALARAMKVPLANFFASTVERRDTSYVRSGEGIRVHRAGSTYGHIYKMIGKVETASTDFETYIISLEKSAEGQPLFQHPGVELIHVLDGRMIYRVGNDEFELAPGDTITFDAEAPHGPRRLESDHVEFLTVISKSPV